MKHLLFPLLLLSISIPSFAMKRETGEPEEQPGKKLKITAQEEKTAFEALPKEIKVAILGFLVTAPGSTKTARLYTAAENIRNFMLTCKEMVAIIEDPRVTGFLIHELAKRYANGDVLDAAIALRTAAAGRWLVSQVQPYTAIPGLNDKIIRRLFSSVEEGKVEITSFLIKYFPKYIIFDDDEDRTLLILATIYEHPAIVERLLRIPGIQINHDDKENKTALHHAVENNNLAIVKLLLTAPNIDTNITDNEELPPWMLAVRKNHTEIAELLLSRPGIQINHQSNLGFTALMYAVNRNNLKLVDRLLSFEGIDVNIQNSGGNTALTLAIVNRLPRIVERLLKMPNINLNNIDFNGNTALMIAVDHGDAELVEQLIKRGDSDINQQNSKRQTALMLAVIKGYLPIVQKLLKVPNINLNIKNQFGITALRIAQNLNIPNKDAIIKLLKEHGAVG